MRHLAWIVLLGLVVGAAWFGYALHSPYQGFSREGVFVDVPHGASARSIARLLAEKGVVRSRLAFEALCRWRATRPLQAGEYFFDHPANTFEVHRILVEGRVFQTQVTVPEGFTMFDIAELLSREGLVSRQEFLHAARNPGLVRDLAPTARSLEGFFFPATYNFPRHITAQEVTEAMVRRFREAWQSLPGPAANPEGLSLHAVVTLASLVERETSVAEERAIIAGVFVNRLRRGIALQCDPTVIYALRLADKYDGSLDSGDLRFESPYNTYRHPGLPPGPIANPGVAALRAAREPWPVDYLYFVANGQGGHLFSRTVEEHNRNVARYRRLLAENAREQNGGLGMANAPEKRANSKRSP